MKRSMAYGINTQNRSMYPCTKEVAQTVAVCHHLATIVFGFKYKMLLFALLVGKLLNDWR